MYSVAVTKHRGSSDFCFTQFKIECIQYTAMEIQPISVFKSLNITLVAMWSEVYIQSAECCWTLLHLLLWSRVSNCFEWLCVMKRQRDFLAHVLVQQAIRKKKMLSDNAVGRLRTARPTTVDRLPQEANVPKCSDRIRAHRVYYLTILSTEISEHGVKLTTHLQPMHSLTICGAKPPLPMFRNGEHKEKLQAK